MAPVRSTKFRGVVGKVVVVVVVGVVNVGIVVFAVAEGAVVVGFDAAVLMGVADALSAIATKLLYHIHDRLTLFQKPNKQPHFHS